MLRIAIQSKGRLHDESLQLLADADLRVSASKRALVAKVKNLDVELLFLRDDDIAPTVADGVADIGIVGLNEVEETGAAVERLMPLGFGGCRLSLAVPKDADYDGPSWFRGRKVATSYPRILEAYFRREGIRADIHVIAGSVEISPSIGLADAIFDIVSSGSTLVSNNLREVAVVMESEAWLVGSGRLDADRQALLDELLFRIRTVRSACGKKYVLMNVPRAHVPDVIRVLPGVKSPTVMPLADEDWCSVHTVLDEDRFWEIIGQLKACGAQGILVCPIEKMIL